MAEQPRRRVFESRHAYEMELAFQRMMAQLEAETPEERLRFDVEHGLRNPDGTCKLPEGDPCVTIIR